MKNELEAINPLKDDQDPRSLVNILPAGLASRIKAIPEEFFDLGEQELEKLGSITESERKLRIAFWLEYERAQRTGSPMAISNIFRGLMHQKQFHNQVVVNSYKLCYLITPLEDYRMTLEDSLRLAIQREKEILKMPIIRMKVTTKKDGSSTSQEIIDTNLALVQHKIRESIQNRLQGMPVHRSMQITENRNVSSSASILDTGFDIGPEALGRMSERELRGLINKLKNESLGPGKSQDDDTEIIEAKSTEGGVRLTDEPSYDESEIKEVTEASSENR